MNESQLEEQKFKVRDIIINELKILKNSEINITTHAAKRKIYNLQYTLGKFTAVKFCDEFKEAVRVYDNCPGANQISENEKTDIFFGAIDHATPGIKNLNFISQQSTGTKLTYDKLKILLIQEEASKNRQVKAR